MLGAGDGGKGRREARARGVPRGSRAVRRVEEMYGRMAARSAASNGNGNGNGAGAQVRTLSMPTAC